jgi:hypothetical protein
VTRKLYALLVGIDQYCAPVPRLYGCINDVDLFEDYLQERVAKSSGVGLELLTLRDAQATRQAVIAGFRDHLGRATRDDVAVFYYCGHGSQEPAPEEFWPIEPDRLDETLVLVDSRYPGQWDLADKELAKLIDEVARKAKHVAIILDCCHSGSATRGDLRTEEAVTRRAPIDRRPRPLSSFIVSVVEAVAVTATRGLDPGSGWASATTGRHVLLAACRDDEEAKEYNGNGLRRGAFSYFLGDTLATAGGELTYRDIHARVKSLVTGQVKAQEPQIEVTHNDDLDARFLDGTMTPTVPYYNVEYKAPDFILRAGATHGISTVTDDGTTVLALFHWGTPNDDLNDLTKKVATAEVVEVQAATSRLKFHGPVPDAPTTFKAVVVGLPTPRFSVQLTGDDDGIALARESLRHAAGKDEPSLYVREAGAGESPDYRLLAREGQYLIAKPGDDRPLVEPIDGYSRANAGKAVEHLEHIACWTAAARLENPTSGIDSAEVELTILQGGKPLEGTALRLEYEPKGGGWTRPAVHIKLKNKGRRPLHFAVIGLSQDFEISAGFFRTGSVLLQPNQEIYAADGQPIPSEVPDEFFNRGILEFQDILKLIVCTDEFDARLMERAPLGLPRAMPRNSTLNRLLNQVQTRKLVPYTAPGQEHGDWRTFQVSFTTVRP